MPTATTPDKRIKRLVAEIERHAARGARRMAEDAAWDLSRLIEDEYGTPAGEVYDYLLGEGAAA